MGKTITEKIFDSHHRDNPSAETVVLDIDVVMCHEITTPIALPLKLTAHELPTKANFELESEDDFT